MGRSFFFRSIVLSNQNAISKAIDRAPASRESKDRVGKTTEERKERKESPREVPIRGKKKKTSRKNSRSILPGNFLRRLRGSQSSCFLRFSSLSPHLKSASLADDEAESLAATSVPCCCWAAAGSVTGAARAGPDTSTKRKIERRREAIDRRGFLLRCCRLRPLGGRSPPPSPGIVDLV